jgi:hypothetical protein
MSGSSSSRWPPARLARRDVDGSYLAMSAARPELLQVGTAHTLIDLLTSIFTGSLASSLPRGGCITLARERTRSANATRRAGFCPSGLLRSPYRHVLLGRILTSLRAQTPATGALRPLDIERSPSRNLRRSHCQECHSPRLPFCAFQRRSRPRLTFASAARRAAFRAISSDSGQSRRTRSEVGWRAGQSNATAATGVGQAQPSPFR